jgi:hypothetical protein
MYTDCCLAQPPAALHCGSTDTCRSTDSCFRAKTLQELDILPPGRADDQLKDGRIIHVPVVRVVVDGRVTHQFRWSHPITSVIDPDSETAGPLILGSTTRRAMLRNISPSITDCLSGCQHLPIRAVRAEGQTSGPSGTMEHGSPCMLVIYGKSVTPAAPPGPQVLQVPSMIARQLKRTNSVLGRSTGASPPPSSQPAGTSPPLTQQTADKSGDPAPSIPKAAAANRATKRTRRGSTATPAPSPTPGGTPATPSGTAVPTATKQQLHAEDANMASAVGEGPQEVDTAGIMQAGTAHVVDAGMPPPTVTPSPSSINKKKRKRRENETAVQQIEVSDAGVLDDAGAEGPALGPSAEGEVVPTGVAPPPAASPPSAAPPCGVSTISSKRSRPCTPAGQPGLKGGAGVRGAACASLEGSNSDAVDDRMHARHSSEGLVPGSTAAHSSPGCRCQPRSTAARQCQQVQEQAQEQQQPAPGKKEKGCPTRLHTRSQPSVAAPTDAVDGKAGLSGQHLLNAACTGQEHAPVPDTPERLVDITRTQPVDDTLIAAPAGQSSPPLAGVHQGPSSTEAIPGTAGVGLSLDHQPRHPLSSHHGQKHVEVGGEAEQQVLHSPEPDMRQGTPPPPAAAPAAAQQVPPAGEECQLPADFIQAYGIQSTQVLTSSKPLGW